MGKINGLVHQTTSIGGRKGELQQFQIGFDKLTLQRGLLGIQIMSNRFRCLHEGDKIHYILPTVSLLLGAHGGFGLHEQLGIG